MAAYGISYGIVDGKTLNKREVVPKFMEAEGFTIDKLEEGTQYWFKVQAIYEEFAGPWSEKVEGTTGKPQPPVNFKVDKNTKAAKWFVDVSWENDPLNDERKLKIEEYKVKCWDSGNPTNKYEKTFSSKGTLSEVKQSGVLAFDDIEKPAVRKRSERWGTAITFTKAAEHTYTLKQAISGVAFDESTGQVTATQPATGIVIVAKRTGYAGSVESDPIDFLLHVADKPALVAEIKKAIDADGATADLNYIDTSDITDMSELFYYVSTFNGDVSKWDTSKVTTMLGMFYAASAFNQSLNSWDVSKVTNVSNMFGFAISFNQDLTSWADKSGRQTYNMFYGATAMQTSNKPCWAR